MSERLFVFDVDGTLTPSRGLIDMEFQKYFMDFCEDNFVYLITGSDREKTIEQVGIDIYYLADRVYNCSGNHVFEQGKEVYKTNLNELMSSLQKNNNQSNIDLGQLQGLLQSQSFLGQLAKGDLLDKLSSEEFLKMIVDEFIKLTKSRINN